MIVGTNHGLKFPIFRSKYRISATSEAKSVMENRLREKSLKNRKFHLYFADILVSDRNFGEISVSGTQARVTDFLLQNIENISEISVKYRRYIGNIGKNIEDISRYIGNVSGYIRIYRKYIQMTRFEILT